MAIVVSKSVSVKIGNDVSTEPIASMQIVEVVKRIEKLNGHLAEFWSESDGWAPAHVAGLLGKSRLDWQISLSASLRLWTEKDKPLTPAELILAWANLGSLIEGSIKLLLSVYFDTFKDDIENLKTSNAYDHKKAEAKSPDGLALDKLRKYVAAQKLFSDEHMAMIELVQRRRNAIHAFQDKPIGDDEEFQTAVRGYLGMLREVVRRLPYPDDVYVPQET